MKTRREFITGASALGLYAGLSGQADAVKFNQPQGRALLGGAGIPAPPAGYGYLFVNDNSGNPQIVFVTDANGISWPILIPGGS